MPRLFVVNRPENWPLKLRGVEIVSSRDYLADPQYSDRKNLRVFNLSRSYRYQSTGYYVSLLAEARGHSPTPSILTLQDLKSQSIVRGVSEDLDELIQKNLSHLTSTRFSLSIYFGRNMARRYDRLSRELFNLFEAPLLRAQFVRQKQWQLQLVLPIAVNDVPDTHRPFLIDAIHEYLGRRQRRRSARKSFRYDLAILQNPDESEPPSDRKALARFCDAAESVGLDPELITKEDYGRLAEFDGLFIRETTLVNHHTYRFSRRAHTLGLAVIDDPASIIRCTNKVFLAELLGRNSLPTPRTVIVNRENAGRVAAELKLPCILKQPDGSFSQGVVKVESEEELQRHVDAMLDKSDLVLAQEFMPTPYDWRVGVLDGRPLYVCRYFMARSHWQILKKTSRGKLSAGRVETVPLDEAPPSVVRLAVRATRLIGNGFYGVDLKQVGRKAYVIEVNDNPSIDAGYEDQFLKGDLYLGVMKLFLRRIERIKEGRATS